MSSSSASVLGGQNKFDVELCGKSAFFFKLITSDIWNYYIKCISIGKTSCMNKENRSFIPPILWRNLSGLKISHVGWTLLQ